MSARDAILTRIRRSLGVNGADIGRRAIVISRLESTPRGIIPVRGQSPQHVRVDLFCLKAEKVSASISRVASEAEIPGAVAGYLRDHNLPAAIRIGGDPLLNGLPWDSTPQIEIARGAADGRDAVSLSHALAGVAESGTIVLASGPENPTTLNFLPETHIVALAATDIVGDYESAFDMIRGRYGKSAMPRTVNLITGPSRSADIEQSLLLGAHGPRRLHLVIVG